MLDALDLLTPDTQPAFEAIGQSDVGLSFTADCQAIAAECAQYVTAPHEWQPDTAGKLLDAYTDRARWLAGQVFMTAWATGLSRDAAREFASLISYLAADTVMQEHLNAGNGDRDYVEFMTWAFVADFEAAFDKLMTSPAYETPRTIN